MADVTPIPRTVLVLGGARSGKSRFALSLAERWWPRPLYLATAEVADDEMKERVALHRQARGEHWGAAEEPLEIASIIRRPPPGRDGILLDCVTIWLSNVMLKEGEGAVRGRLDDLVDALRSSPLGIVLVSNEVGWGIVPATPLGRRFRDLAGWANQDLAAAADAVALVVAGLPLMLKGAVNGPGAPA